MARAGAAAAAVLFAVVCCLLVAPAPARRPVELPPQVVPDAVDSDAAAEPLLLNPVAEEEEEDVGPARQVSSLLCLIFRCDGDEVALSSSEETPSLDGWAQPVGKAEVEDDEVGEDGQERPCDSDSTPIGTGIQTRTRTSAGSWGGSGGWPIASDRSWSSMAP